MLQVMSHDRVTGGKKSYCIEVFQPGSMSIDEKIKTDILIFTNP